MFLIAFAVHSLFTFCISSVKTANDIHIMVVR